MRNDASSHESIADESQEDPFEHASRSELNALIAKCLRQLPSIQQKVLALHYHEDLRLQEIAEVFGLTASRISQIHTKAIKAVQSFIERQEAMASLVLGEPLHCFPQHDSGDLVHGREPVA